MKNIEQLNEDELRKEVYRLQKFERIVIDLEHYFYLGMTKSTDPIQRGALEGCMEVYRETVQKHL